MKKCILCLWIFIFLGQYQLVVAQSSKDHFQEYLIQTKPSVNLKYLIERLGILAPSLAQSIKGVHCIAPSLSIWCLRCLPTTDISKLLSILRSHPDIIAIQNNHSLIKSRGYLTNDPLYTSQWQFINDKTNTLDIDIDAEEAWQITKGGYTHHQDTIVVAVIDEGVLDTHPDLTHNIWRNPHEIPNNGIDDDQNGWVDDELGWNFKTNNNNVNNDGFGHWHGTPVAGIIGAEGNNGVGVTGVNWQVKLMHLVKGKDEASIIGAYNYVLAMRRAYNESDGKRGAFIVVAHASWGIDSLKATDAPLWCNIYDALGEAGVLSVASTTNNDTNVDTGGDMPTACPSNYLITVTNTNNFDQKVQDAGYGKQSIDLAAPGFNSLTTSNTGRYDFFGGTSAAAPYVSGAVALLYSIPSSSFIDSVKMVPGHTALRLKQFILTGVDHLSNLENLTVSGGRLNLYRSIQQFNNYYRLSENKLLVRPSRIYPNPAKDNQVFLKINLVQSTQVFVNISDAFGRTLKSYRFDDLPQGIHRIRLDLADLPNGSYLCVVRESGNQQIIRLVKN